jgi:hypothetical protein
VFARTLQLERISTEQLQLRHISTASISSLVRQKRETLRHLFCQLYALQRQLLCCVFQIWRFMARPLCMTPLGGTVRVCIDRGFWPKALAVPLSATVPSLIKKFVIESTILLAGSPTSSRRVSRHGQALANRFSNRFRQPFRTLWKKPQPAFWRGHSQIFTGYTVILARSWPSPASCVR